MDHFVDERDLQLLQNDRYTFYVLSRVLGGPCAVIRTDHESLILCHTEHPYPVWLWTPDGLTEAEKERAWQLAQETCPMAEGYRYNLKYALAERNRNYPVVSLTTQVVVDREDPAFRSPTKPIGAFYPAEEARRLEQEKGYAMREDSGRGWRRVVASPKPKRIVEIGAVKLLWDHAIVITCGGGGIPVVERPDGTLEGVPAVIDKDLAAELLAEEVQADVLLILTEVEKVAIRFGQPDQQDLSHLSLAEAARYAEEGQFGVGSMLPKVEAAMKFVRANPDKRAIITSLDKCLDALDGKTGTIITFA